MRFGPDFEKCDGNFQKFGLPERWRARAACGTQCNVAQHRFTLRPRKFAAFPIAESESDVQREETRKCEMIERTLSAQGSPNHCSCKAASRPACRDGASGDSSDSSSENEDDGESNDDACYKECNGHSVSGDDRMEDDAGQEGEGAEKIGENTIQLLQGASKGYAVNARRVCASSSVELS